MNIIQAHIHRGDCIEAAESVQSVYIRSCGHFYDIDKDCRCYRSQGRDDYQMIFVENGCVYEGEDFEKVSRGGIIIYKPGQTQMYTVRFDEKTAYYWVHFAGDGGEKLLESMGLNDKTVYSNMDFAKYMPLIYKMISEMRLRRINYEEQTACYFFELLNGICRDNFSIDSTDTDYNRILPALNAMELQMSKPYTLEDYASMCSMSKYHFVHTFKKHVGQSPMQYKNSVTMEQAKYFLAHSDMSVGEISEAVGISDSMYFSKKFRSYTGLSPREYRAKRNKGDVK